MGRKIDKILYLSIKIFFLRFELVKKQKNKSNGTVALVVVTLVGVNYRPLKIGHSLVNDTMVTKEELDSPRVEARDLTAHDNNVMESRRRPRVSVISIIIA